MRRFMGVALTAVLVGMPAAAQAQHAHGDQGMQQDLAGHATIGQGMHKSGMMGHGMMAQGMGGQGMGMIAQGMMGMIDMIGNPGGPGAILARRTALKLTSAQVTQLEQVQQRTQKETAAAMQQMHTAAAQARNALDGETPDLRGYEAAMRAMTEPMIAAHVARARATVDAHQLLTPEQRKEFQSKSSAQSGMMAMCDGMLGKWASP